MLPKPHRLLSEKDFQKIWKRGSSFYTKTLGFKVLKNNFSVSRFGIVVGTKISKLATVRNRAKRQIREIIQENLKKITPGYDFVITVLPAALGKNYSELKKDVILGLKHFNLIEK
ncbi:ribonuclease P protein component [Patescibacteria group bacterium]|nr:ribonuclease P protein component [Patescibacteria group bacterium]